jgi:hypothetical protein
MPELSDLLWEKAEPVLFITKDEYLATLAEWVIKPVHLDGELAWITVQKGPEFHFQSVGKTRVMPLRLIREFLQGILSEHGFALTKTPIEDTRQQRFNERFGFHRVGQDQYDVHYRLDHLPHG